MLRSWSRATPTSASPVREHELKMSLPLARVSIVAGWLSALNRPDGAYPRNVLHTLYFDDPHLTSLAQKIDGDCGKTKLRLRWYTAAAGDSTSRVFLEVKERSGATRGKRRFELSLDPQEILAAPFATALGDRVTAELARRTGWAVQPLRATVLLTYRRSRFVEPNTRARISLDTDIEPLAVHPAMARPVSREKLPFAVVEVKSTQPELPRSLHWLTALGCRPRAISKYALCLAGQRRFEETAP